MFNENVAKLSDCDFGNSRRVTAADVNTPQNGFQENSYRFDNYSCQYVDMWSDAAGKLFGNESVPDRDRVSSNQTYDVMMPRPYTTEAGYNKIDNLPAFVDVQPLSYLTSVQNGYRKEDEKLPKEDNYTDTVLSPKIASQADTPQYLLSPTMTSLTRASGCVRPKPFQYDTSPTSYENYSNGIGSVTSPLQDRLLLNSGAYGQNGGNYQSMSVNVSMSMNVGVAPPGQQHGSFPDQWDGRYGSQQRSSAGGATYSPPTYELTSQSQYAPYSAAPYPQPFLASCPFPSGYSDKHVTYDDASDPYHQPSAARLYGAEAPGMRKTKAASTNQSNRKPNLCRMCGKTYARPSTLKTHMRTHSGEKPYRCSTCNKSFSQAANLTAHARTHSGEKPFRCTICRRRFSQSSSVTTHMRTHSGERPYRCRMCRKSFSDSSTLTKHLRIHSGEKPYQCKVCLLRFSQSGNLNRHLRVHVNNN